MRTIKTYSKGAPFYNAFIRPYWELPDVLLPVWDEHDKSPRAVCLPPQHMECLEI
jgi:hypothetical protein